MIHLATVLGSALAFLVQPLVAKSLLPFHGGAPAVWATCLAFFQLALLIGYAQAYLIARRRAWIALCGLEALLALVLLAHAVMTRGVPLATSADPLPGPHALVLELMRMIGLPFVLLATGSPLLAGAASATGRAPWRLFAVSNVASLGALLAYPLVLEPTCTLGVLRWGWTLGFAAWIPLAAIACGRGGPGRPAPEGTTTRPTRPAEALRWVAWSALGAGMLVATSQHLGQEIAVTPMLMVAPLAVFLAAYATAFAEAAWAAALVRAAAVAFPVSLLLVATAVRRADELSPLLAAAIPLGVLGAASLYAHGALVRLRPAPARLEAFYLAIAAGGAIGGGGVALGAPHLVPAALEFPVLLLVCAWLVAAKLVRETPCGAAARVHPRWAMLALFAAAMSLAAWSEDAANAALRARGWGLDPRAPYLFAGVVVVLTLEVLRRLPRGAGLRPDRPGWRVLAVAILLVVLHVATIEPWIALLRGPRAISRSFFGTLRVLDRAIDGHPARMLYHGAVRHGLVRFDPAGRDEPGSYYGRDGGLGRVISTRRARSAGVPLTIGAVGLGVGSLVLHAEPGDRIEFIELDPDVRDLAEGQGGHFDLLARARQRGVAIEIMVGDGRIELARRAASRYDVIVVDAFSGGTIPTHLLTQEAFAVYAGCLRDRAGVIAVHLSSQHFDLRPVVAGAARVLGLETAYLAAKGDSARGTDTSLWMALARDRDVLDDPSVRALEAEVPDAVGGERVWSDDWSSLMGLGWRR